MPVPAPNAWSGRPSHPSRAGSRLVLRRRSIIVRPQIGKGLVVNSIEAHQLGPGEHKGEASAHNAIMDVRRGGVQCDRENPTSLLDGIGKTRLAASSPAGPIRMQSATSGCSCGAMASAPCGRFGSTRPMAPTPSRWRRPIPTAPPATLASAPPINSPPGPASQRTPCCEHGWGFSHALVEAVANGDCASAQDDLFALAGKLLERDGAILATVLWLEIASDGVNRRPEVTPPS
jgi:hypothetical protein